MITEPDERYEAYCASSDFIREHIFPGGHLPSMGAMIEAARPTQLQARRRGSLFKCCRCPLVPYLPLKEDCHEVDSDETCVRYLMKSKTVASYHICPS